MREVEKIKGRDLRRLLEQQGYKCALTGRPLTPETASADHIIPVGRGGSHSVDNIWIVHTDVNIAKGTLPADVFIEMCRDVAAWASGNKLGH